MAYDDEDDLNKWLASQRAPSLDAPSAAAPQDGGGAWSRAAQLLASGGYGSDPAPKNDISWKTVLGMVLSKDPGAVMLADQEGRRKQIDDWAQRHSPDAMFARQHALAGTLMQEDAGKRASAAQQFEQDRAMANDIEQAANTDWTHTHTAERDKVTDAQNALENQRASAKDKEQIREFDLTQGGLDRRNREDNQRALEVAQANAAVRSEAQQALAQSRADAAAAKKDALDQREYNDFRNKNTKLFDLAQAARGIENVWARHPVDDKPGAGVFDGSDSKLLHPFGFGQSDDDMAVRANFKALQEYLQNKVTGASAPKDQAARIAAIAGAQSGATEQEARVSLETIRNNLKDQLRAAGSGREAAARKVLADMGGLDKWVYGNDPTPEQAAAEQPQLQPGAADDFQPKGVKLGKQVPYATPGDLGPPVAIDADDWKKRYERFKLGGGQP